jgi:hypothetical protein
MMTGENAQIEKGKVREMADIFFSAGHKDRFLAAMRTIGKISAGKLDPEYAAALYVLTADRSTWRKAQQYVDRSGIDIPTMLEQVDFSSGDAVLIQWAGNLFNNQIHIDPIELLRLDESHYEVALSALSLRRYGCCVDDFALCSKRASSSER